MKGAEKKDERHETKKLSDVKQSVAEKDENKSESVPVGALPTEAAETGAAADRDTATQSKDVHLEATSAASKEPGWFTPVSVHLQLWNMTLPQQSQVCTENSLRNLRRRLRARLFHPTYRPPNDCHLDVSGLKSWI